MSGFWRFNVGNLFSLIGVVCITIGWMWTNSSRFEREVEEGQSARAKYIPIIIQHDQVIELIKERQSAQGNAINALQQSQSEILRMITAMQQDVAVIRARLPERHSWEDFNRNIEQLHVPPQLNR